MWNNKNEPSLNVTYYWNWTNCFRKWKRCKKKFYGCDFRLLTGNVCFRGHHCPWRLLRPHRKIKPWGSAGTVKWKPVIKTELGGSNSSQMHRGATWQLIYTFNSKWFYIFLSFILILISVIQSALGQCLPIQTMSPFRELQPLELGSRSSHCKWSLLTDSKSSGCSVKNCVT